MGSIPISDSKNKMLESIVHPPFWVFITCSIIFLVTFIAGITGWIHRQIKSENPSEM